NMSFSYGGDSGKMDKDFVRDDKKELVKDLKSGIIYYDAAPSEKMNYNNAIAYCSNLTYLNHTDWKLPSKEELKAILELGRRDLNVKRAFKNIQEGIYWSSTKDRHDEAWYVDFDLGRYSTASYDREYYILCVSENKEHSKSTEAFRKEGK
ncbi:MAG: DUF1566 domain-containing protein, partial [Campylobacterota bacterium]|nr:DUF1566 domain-containing protein [Campylobacterota bacterium]